MIVGEVKEGAPRLNRALRDPRALQAALTRFGCCTAAEADDAVGHLLRHGTVLAPAGHSVRVVAFGNPHKSPATGAWHTVSLDHPTLGLLALLEKSTRAGHHTRAPR